MDWTYFGAATFIGNWSTQRCRRIPSHSCTPTMPNMKNTKKHSSSTLPSMGNVSSSSITRIRIPFFRHSRHENGIINKCARKNWNCYFILFHSLGDRFSQPFVGSCQFFQLFFPSLVIQFYWLDCIIIHGCHSSTMAKQRQISRSEKIIAHYVAGGGRKGFWCRDNGGCIEKD